MSHEPAIPPDRGSVRPRLPAGLALLAAVPWAWFVIRNGGASLEPVAVMLPVITLAVALLAALWALVTRRIDRLALVVSLLVFFAVTTLSPRAPMAGPAPVRTVRLASANVYGSNRLPAEAARGLLEQEADVLVVVEAPRSLAQRVTGTYPYAAGGSSLAIYSRYPLTELPAPVQPRRHVLRARVEGPDGLFLVYAVHALNPLYDISWAAHLRFVEQLASRAGTERLPVVIAGDFNMSDRGQGYRAMSGAFRDAVRTGWTPSTFAGGLWRWLFLRIDHVFTSSTWCSADGRSFDVPGSDHEGVAATVGPCPA